MVQVYNNIIHLPLGSIFKKYIQIFFLHTIVFNVAANDFNPKITLYTVNEGLHDNNINDVLQDSYGFLWLAGMGGIQKYDGYTFTHYVTDSVNQAWQQAEGLWEDSNRNLWVKLNEGLVRYNRELDVFNKLHFIDSSNDTIPYVISALAEDLNGMVWFWVQDKGLFTIDEKSMGFIANDKVNDWYKNNPEIIVNCMVFDIKNQLWLGTHFLGLFRIDYESIKFKNYEADPDHAGGLSNRRITQAYRDNNGDLWFATRRGLNRYDSEKDSFERFYIVPSEWWNELNSIDRMVEDAHGNIWTVNGTVKGFGCLNKKSKKYIYYSKNLDPFISSITIDRSGIVWLSCFYQGIYKLEPNPKKFSAFSVEKGDRDVLEGKIIQAVLEDKNDDIWFGGDVDGLYRYNRETEEIRHYHLNRTDADTIYSNFILDIFEDSKGILWIGTQSGLIRFDPKTEQFKHINPAPSIYEGLSKTASILEDENQNLWLITLNGILARYNILTQETVSYAVPDKSLIFSEFVANSSGDLWIGTLQNGLYKFNKSGKNFSKVKELVNYNIDALYLEKDSVLWCATNGNGLIRFNTSTKSITVFGEKQGLLSNGILGMEMDKSGNFWLSSQKGLCMFNPLNNVIHNYFKEDGFLSDEFTYKAHFKAESGELIFGSTRGVVTFQPDSIIESTYNPPIVFTDLKIDNKSVSPGLESPFKKHVSICNEIILKYDQNDVSITFSSLDFTHPERNEYSFYLENMEEDFRPSGKERTAYYTNLEPGEYIFRAKGTNSDGAWNEEGASLIITVLPPWWKTVWAYMTYGFIIALVIYFIRRYELNRQKLKYEWELKQVEAEQLFELDKLKSRFFADISHEFRTPLSLILGPVEDMMRKKQNANGVESDQLNLIHRNASRLKRLINQLLDLSKLETGKVRLKVAESNLSEFVRTIALSFLSLAESKGIDYQMKLEETSEKTYFDQDKLEKIVTNLLSNAFKFTPENGRVNVRLKFKSDDSVKRNSFAEITVTDSGIGIPEELQSNIFNRFFQISSSSKREFEGTGIGLALVKELTDIYRGRIEIDSSPGKGSRFTVYLPVNRVSFNEDEILLNTIEKKEFNIDAIEPQAHQEDVGQVNSIENQELDRNKQIILVVEDHVDLQKYIRRQLLDDANVIVANNGNDGLVKAIDVIPDLIITDLMMPEMDGMELCAKLKEDERTSHIPIVMLTAKADMQSKLEGLKTGADDYLIKPFNAEELKTRVKNLIDQRNKLKENFKLTYFNLKGKNEIKSSDDRFLKKASDVVLEHLGDASFSVEMLSSLLGMSASQLYRKLQATTGNAPSHFISNLRLKQSLYLIEKGYDNMAQIAYEVGFSDHSYFSKRFRELFGMSPTEYKNKQQNNSA